MFVYAEYTHDHTCRWQGDSLSRLYPVWTDGTYEPVRLTCADLGVELTLVSVELRGDR